MIQLLSVKIVKDILFSGNPEYSNIKIHADETSIHFIIFQLIETGKIREYSLNYT